MSTRRFAVIIIGGALVSAVIGIACYLLAPPANLGFSDAATTLAVISASALAIERLLEAAWSALGSRAGDWWPLDIINREVATFDVDLHAVADRFFDEASTALQVAASTDAQLAQALPQVTDQLESMRTQLRDQLARLQDLSPGSQRTNLIATRITNAVNLADARFRPLADGVMNAVNDASQSIASAADFLAGVRENPGKQLLSIWAGTSIGMVVATALGIDVFAAILGPETVDVGGVQDPLGIVITGAVIGLGAGPTHELVRVLQEVKKSRRASNGPSGPMQDAESAIAALLGGSPPDGTRSMPATAPEAVGPGEVNSAATATTRGGPPSERELTSVIGYAGAPEERAGQAVPRGVPAGPTATTEVETGAAAAEEAGPGASTASSASVLAALSATRPTPRRVGTYNLRRN